MALPRCPNCGKTYSWVWWLRIKDSHLSGSCIAQAASRTYFVDEDLPKRGPSSARSATGGYVSRNGKTIAWEAALMRDLLLDCDYLPGMTEMEAPAEVEELDSVSIMLRTESAAIAISAVRESSLLKDGGLRRFVQTASYCSEHGISYCFYTDSTRYERSDRIEVLKYIDHYGRHSEDVTEAERLAIREFEKLHPCSLKELVNSLEAPAPNYDKRTLVCGLIVKGLIAVSETPTSNVDDCILMRPLDGPTPDNFLVGYSRMLERIKTHPLRFIDQSDFAYYKGMPELNLAGHRYRVLDSSSPTSVVVQSIENQEVYHVALDRVPRSGGKLTALALQEDNSEAYYKLLYRIDIVEKLALLSEGKRLTRDRKMEAGVHLGGRKPLSVRQVERLVRAYNELGSDGLISARGGKGRHRVSPEVESIIKAEMAQRSKPESPLELSGKKIHEAMCKRIAELNEERESNQLEPCSLGTVYNRINEMSPRHRKAKLDGAGAADNAYGLYLGEFPDGSYPLQTTFIDQTPADLLIRLRLVDPGLKSPVRPNVTLLSDACTRTVGGFWVDVEEPDANAVGLLVLMCTEPKDRYVKEWDMQEWPVQGVPWQVHFDNDQKYVSKLIYVGLTQNGIKPTYRPKAQPRYGGLLERLFRTVEEKYVHERPGTTKSNIQKRGEYNSGEHADLTIPEFVKEFAQAIDKYHHTPSRSLGGRTPIQEWERMVALHGRPNQLRDQDAWKFRVRLLPCAKRTIGKDGIEFFGRKYGSDELDREAMPDAQGNILLRYDTENTNEVYVFDHRTGDYLVVPALKQTDEPIVFRQWVLARHELEHEGDQSPSEESTLQRYRERIARLWELAPSSGRAARKLESMEMRSEVSERNGRRRAMHPAGRKTDPPIGFTPDPTILSGITPVEGRTEERKGA